MTKEKSAEILGKIGVDMNSSQMMIFKAVLSAAGSTSKPVTYAEISAALEKLSLKKYTKAYVYQHLNDLEQEGFVTIDAIQHPRRYTIIESAISQGLKTKSQVALSKLLTRRQDITTRLNVLETSNPQDAAITAYNALVGISSVEGSVMIEGIENVRSTIIREFADGAKPGDYVRVLAPASTLADGLGPEGLTELRIMQGGAKGVKVLGMLIPVQQEMMSVELIAGHLKTIAGAFVQAVSTGNIQLKLAREPIQTYRMVSRNNDKMLLYLTQAKASDIAALIHRKDNPGLIDDAVNTFDKLWETGIDIMGFITQMVSPG